VLLGTSSFWQGVDFAGDALTVLIIARLPFTVPSDPIFQARSEQYEREAFNKYAIPQAILKFRQGFGRLIRSSRDRGIAIVMDSRITSSRYGRRFIQSLPEMTVTDGKGRGTSTVVNRWLEYTG
jgi:DNA polymerase-3 subunit epsilon/ATP-dependent DNA helicase DinG